jgi:hypothetical protein
MHPLRGGADLGKRSALVNWDGLSESEQHDEGSQIPVRICNR